MHGRSIAPVSGRRSVRPEWRKVDQHDAVLLDDADEQDDSNHEVMKSIVRATRDCRQSDTPRDCPDWDDERHVLPPGGEQLEKSSMRSFLTVGFLISLTA